MYYSPSQYAYSAHENNIRYIYTENTLTNESNIIEPENKLNENVENNRINLLGLDLNIDDIVILITMFFIFQNEDSCDLATIIALGLLLLSQG